MPRIIQPFETLKDYDDKPRKMHTINPSLMTFDEFVLQRGKTSFKVVFCSKRNSYFEGSGEYDMPAIFTTDGCHRERKYFAWWLSEGSIEWSEVIDELGMRGGSMALDIDIDSPAYHEVVTRLEYTFGEPVSQNMVIWQMDVETAKTYYDARTMLLNGEKREYEIVKPYPGRGEIDIMLSM